MLYGICRKEYEILSIMAEIFYLCLHCAFNAYVGIKLEGDAVCITLPFV